MRPNHLSQLLRQLIQEKVRRKVSEFLRLDDIAQDLGMSLRTIHHLNQKGLGPKCVRVGRRFLVSKDDYAAWLKSCEQD